LLKTAHDLIVHDVLDLRCMRCYSEIHYAAEILWIK
jgi:hypothetical protein